MRIRYWSSDVCSSDLMDIAGGITAGARAAGRVATVAVDAMVFHRPVYIGDVLCTYADILRIGRTSIAIHIEAWALRSRQGERVKVPEGTFTLVAIDDTGRPRPVHPEAPVADGPPPAGRASRGVGALLASQPPPPQ